MSSTFKRQIQGVVRVFRSGSWQNPHGQKIAEQLIPVPDPFETALFNFSIDFELGLGNARDNNRKSELTLERRVADYQAQKNNTLPFIDLISKLRFPVTWALIGRLIEPQYPIQNKFHPEWADSDWYELSSAFVDFEQTRSIVLEKIKETLGWCELASHGHAHIDFSDAATTNSVAQEDISVSLKLLTTYFGKTVDTFVYPCNQVEHLSAVKKNGLRIIRGNEAQWRLEDDLIKTPIGFWISPGIMSFNDLKKVIDLAIEKKAFVHPWMHLVECDLTCADLDNFYRPLFEYVLELQDKGKIQTISFGDICNTLI